MQFSQSIKTCMKKKMQLKETTGRAHTCIFSSDMKFISFDLFLLVIRKCRLIH